MSPGPEAPPLDPEGFRELLDSEAPAFGLNVSTSTVSRLALYLAELDAWRRTTNLTGPLSSRALAQHALESILPVDLIVHGARVVDIGSGAGFPGLPIGIARPDLEVTLLEPRKKRTAFLRHAARMLDLASVQVAETRIEKVGGQTFHVAVTRAVGHIEQWLGDANFLEPSGLLMAWTTSNPTSPASLPRLVLESEIRIPESRHRVVAIYRRN